MFGLKSPLSRALQTLVLSCLGITLTALAATHQLVVEAPQDDVKEQLTRAYQLNLKKAPHQSTGELLHHLRAALEPLGYFEAQLIIDDRDTGTVHLHVESLGPRVRWRRVQLDCQASVCQVAPIKAALDAFTIKPGQPFDTTTYQHALRQLRHRLHDCGYLTAFVAPTVHVHQDTHTAMLDARVILGPQYWWGRITWSGTHLRPEVLAGFVRNTSGVYRSDRMSQLESDVIRSGYFREARAEPRMDAEHHRVDVVIRAKDQQAVPRTFGFGFDTDVGWQGLAHVNWPRLNDHGHKLYLQAHLGTRETSAAMRYMIPGYNILYDQWVFGSQVQQERRVTGENTTTSLQLQHLHYAPRWRSDVGLKVLLERSRPTARPAYDSVLLYPRARLTMYTRWGKEGQNRIRWQWSGRGAKRHVLSTVSFAQMEGAMTGNIVLRPRWSLLYRGTLGRTFSTSLSDVPLSLQYTTGGSHHLRGYAFDSIGPGRWLVEGSLAHYVKLTPSWSISQFMDVGQVSDHLHHRLKQSMGLGLLWLTAVGGIEISVAKPLHDATRRDWRLHLGVHSKRFFPSAEA